MGNLKGTLIGALCTLVASVSLASTAAPKVTAQVVSLNKKIQAAGATWVAKDTWLMHLSSSELQHLTGLNRKMNPDIEFSGSRSAVKFDLPRTLDWRNKDGKNWISPMMNQANCGSCVAFAAIGVMESQYRIASGIASFNIDLSPQNLFSCGGGYCDFGWQPESASQFLQQTGVTDEACQPYISGATGKDVACNAACSDAEHRRIKIANFNSPTLNLRDVNSVKQALQNGPVVTTLQVYSDFLAYAGGVYKHVTGSVVGGHAVSIVGYDDDTQSYIIRNSWGVDWGENGFAHVAYDDVSGIGDETWSYQIAIGGAVSLESPRDYTYVTDSLNVKATSTFNGTNLQTITIFDSQLKPVYSGTCAAQNCDQAVSVANLADGHYEAQVTAQDSVGKVLGSSPRQAFLVANHPADLALTYAAKSGTDLTKPLSGRPEFQISAHSSTVPMSGIEFHIRPLSGAKEIVKHVSIVLESMTMGWRTTTIPNGQYEIWMVGHIATNSMDQKVESAHTTVEVKN